MHSPLEVLWLLKSQLVHHDLLAQRRTKYHEEMQPSTNHSQTVQTLGLEQPQLFSTTPPSSFADADPQQEKDGETNKVDNKQTSIDSEERSEAHQPTSSGISNSSKLHTNPSSQQSHQNKPGPRHNRTTWYVTEAARAVFSSLITVPAYLFQRKARKSPVTANRDPTWKFVGISVVGTSHSKKQTPCQDAYLVQELPGGELVIAVADGAGSASLSREGAKLAVHVAVNFLNRVIPLYKPNTPKEWKVLVSQSFEQARACVINHAVQHSRYVKDYATTLQIVVLSDQWIVSAIVGDGAAVVLDIDNSLVPVMTPQRGEYANATNFITSNSAMKSLVVKAWHKPVLGVAVLTDGLLNLSIEERNNKPVPNFFQPLFNFLANTTSRQQAAVSLAQFLQSDQINRKTDDDKTLVLALRWPLLDNGGVTSCDLKQLVEEELP